MRIHILIFEHSSFVLRNKYKAFGEFLSSFSKQGGRNNRIHIDQWELWRQEFTEYTYVQAQNAKNPDSFLSQNLILLKNEWKISFFFGSHTLANPHNLFHFSFYCREIKVRRYGAFNVKDSKILVKATLLFYYKTDSHSSLCLQCRLMKDNDSLNV